MSELERDIRRLNGVGGDRIFRAQCLWSDEAQAAMKRWYKSQAGLPGSGLKWPYRGPMTWDDVDVEERRDYLRRAAAAVDEIIARGAGRGQNGGWVLHSAGSRGQDR